MIKLFATVKEEEIGEMGRQRKTSW